MLDVPAGMHVRGGRRHDGGDVLVRVGDCCGDCGEWIVGEGDTFLSFSRCFSSPVPQRKKKTFKGHASATPEGMGIRELRRTTKPEDLSPLLGTDASAALFSLDCVTLMALTGVAPDPSSLSLVPADRASPPAVSPAHASPTATVPFARVCVPHGARVATGAGRLHARPLADTWLEAVADGDC